MHARCCRRAVLGERRGKKKTCCIRDRMKVSILACRQPAQMASSDTLCLGRPIAMFSPIVSEYITMSWPTSEIAFRCSAIRYFSSLGTGKGYRLSLDSPAVGDTQDLLYEAREPSSSFSTLFRRNQTSLCGASRHMSHNNGSTGDGGYEGLYSRRNPKNGVEAYVHHKSYRCELTCGDLVSNKEYVPHPET